MTLRSFIVRVASFGLLVSAFWALGGFERPVPAAEDYRSIFRVGKAWFFTVALFLVGAGLATLGEILTSALDQDYPPALLVIIGVVLMIAGSVWMRAIRGTVHLPNQPAAGNAGSAPSLASPHVWSGVPEPGRSGVLIWPR